MSFADSLSGTKLSLVSFSADWCGPCQTMLPTLHVVQQQFQDSVEYLEIDIDKNPMIAAAFKIRSVPSLLLFKSGEVLWRYAGIIQAKDLIGHIKEYL